MSQLSTAQLDLAQQVAVATAELARCPQGLQSYHLARDAKLHPDAFLPLRVEDEVPALQILRATALHAILAYVYANQRAAERRRLSMAPAPMPRGIVSGNYRRPPRSHQSGGPEGPPHSGPPLSFPKGGPKAVNPALDPSIAAEQDDQVRRCQQATQQRLAGPFGGCIDVFA